MKSNLPLLWLLVLSFATLAWAGDPAVTDPAQVDSAYHYLGEYVGDWQGLPVGIQVSTRKREVPFYAKLFEGGLPGAGWNNAPPRLFTGSMAGSQLRLIEQGSSVQLDVTPSVVTLAEADARAEFRKVGRRSVTLGLVPPPGSLVLFDGQDASKFKSIS